MNKKRWLLTAIQTAVILLMIAVLSSCSDSKDDPDVPPSPSKGYAERMVPVIAAPDLTIVLMMSSGYCPPFR